jgi:hypothetical protein
MTANPRFDVYLVAGTMFAALNLLHMLLWAAGLYLPIGAHVLVAVPVLGIALWQRRLNALLVTGLLILFTLIPLLHPATEWDTRSIWLFHAKRIYLDGSLYALLDNYAPWTHNDYPVLGPAMSASIARSMGHWNEIAPRAAVGIALAPALFFAAYTLRSWAVYCIWVCLLLLTSWANLLSGYMDALVAANFSVALMSLAELYRRGWDREAAMPIGPGVALAVSMAQLLFLKNEGAVMAFLLSMALLPAMVRRPRLWLVAGLPWLLFALLWKLPVMQAGIVSDLLHGGGLVERGWQRLQSFQEYGLILHFFNVLSFRSFAIVGLLLATLAIWPRRLGHIAPPLAAVMGFVSVVFLVFLTTFQDLKWHLETAAERVLMAFDLGAATLLLYLAYRLLVSAPASWRLRSDSGD